MLHKSYIKPYEGKVLWRPHVVPLSCGVLVCLPDDLDLKIVTALEEESSTCEQQDSANVPRAS